MASCPGIDYLRARTMRHAVALAVFAFVAATPAPAAEGKGRASWREPIAQLRDGFAVVRHDREISRPIILLAAATLSVPAITAGVARAHIAMAFATAPTLGQKTMHCGNTTPPRPAAPAPTARTSRCRTWSAPTAPSRSSS